MNTVSRKPTIDDTFKFIWHDYHCPNTDTNRKTDWMPSQDIKDQQPLLFMELAEKFVESVAKSDVLPFDFNKSMYGTILKEGNRLGELFYELLRQQNQTAVNPDEVKPHLRFTATSQIRNCDRARYAEYKYEISENLKILYAVASDLNLHRANFTGDPMSRIGTGGMFEGELINSFVTRLQEATKRESFKTKVAEREREPRNSIMKSIRYIDRLYANHPSLYGVRMVFCYRNYYANSIILEESADHLVNFLEAFETNPKLGSPVGWWWKREFITEVGYRYHLIIFFDGRKTAYKPKQFQDVYNRHWHSVTRNQGTSFIPPVPEMDYQLCGAGLPQQEYEESLESLLLSIQCMLFRDIFLRLERRLKFDHFGMGKLPRSTSYKPPKNSVTQPR